MNHAGAPDSTRVHSRGKCSTRRCSRAQRGFTLIEMIISAGLLGMLALTATFFWVDGMGLVRTVNTDSAAVADGRAVLERLAREIREVKFNTTTGLYCVSTMAATQMVFNKTIGSYATGCGGATPAAATNDIAVTVQRSTAITLQYLPSPPASAASGVLTDYPSTFAIRYLDAGYAVTASVAALRFVELTLTLQPTSQQATSARTVVALRND
jgi:prepilin-type N-terminal cleavage/methylation domain-containing protein